MASIKCPTCGAWCKFEFGKGYVCPSCRNTYNGAEMGDDIIEKLNYATEKRRENYDFDGALDICKKILKKDPNNQEGNWCALLAYYKIVYLKNANGEYRPTFLEPDAFAPINHCQYYEKLNTDYQIMADLAEKVRKEVVYESKNIPAYDVFISYKQHVGNSNINTEESAWAAELYKKLSKIGLNVFYDEVSLKNGSAGWEPHIYSALKSANYLVVLGSSLENINSVWVKNEWKRFLSYKVNDKKSFTVVAKNVKPELLDYDLGGNQMVFADNPNWLNELLEKIKAHVLDVDYYLKDADACWKKREFKKAKKLYLSVCKAEPRNSKAYWGLLNCRLKTFDDYDLVVYKKNIGEMFEYKQAHEYADREEKLHYEKVCIDNLRRDPSDYDRKNYYAWLQKHKGKRIFKNIVIWGSVIALAAFGVFSYLGISQPVVYAVEDGKVTLKGKSIYFDYVVNDLEIASYKGQPVVKIADGALKNSDIKSISLAESISEIGNNAFENCKNLTSITIKECEYLGSNVFSGCSNLTEITIGISDNTQIAEDAFANLASGITINVPTVAEEVTAELVAAYPNVNFITYTQDTVKECVYFIAKLSSVTPKSDEDIKKAESLYNALSAEEKTKVPNYARLQNAKITLNTVVAISEIGGVTLNSEKAILKAENSYNSLTLEQKRTVANYSVLTSARAIYNTMSKIADIGKVDLSSEVKIATAEQAYFALTYEQRDLVLNYSVLTAARAEVDALLVKEVTAKIAAIGTTVTLDKEIIITVAEEAYNNLTQAQKAQVLNYDILTDARAVYNTIKAIANISVITPNSGNLITIAKTFYDKLTPSQILKVTNNTDLVNAIAAYAVVSQIAEIGSVMPDSLPAIQNAETEYAKLSVGQQALVSNHNVLVDSRKAYATVLEIENIGGIGASSIEKIENALTSFNDLSSEQQALVGNYSKLLDCSRIYDTMKAIDDIGTVSLESLEKIANAESLYNELSSEIKQNIATYNVLRAARAIYEIETIVKNLGSLVLGSGTNYNYKTLNAENMVAELNNAATREQVDSVTREGYSLFTESENNAFFNAFSNFKIIRYDVSKNKESFQTFTIPAHCTSIGLIGDRDYIYLSSQIKFESRYSNVNLELWNFNINSAEGEHAIDATAVSSQYTVTLSFAGSCNVKAAAGSSGSNGYKFSPSSSNRTGTGGSGVSGNVGMSGIKGNDVIINVAVSANVEIVGGNGGSGGSGGNSACYSKGLSGHTKLGSGGIGGSGGNGGDGINVSALYVLNEGSLKVVGGDGGSGGSGGTGASDVNYFGAEPDNGGDGGLGGNGGNGGCGIKTDSIIIQSNQIFANGGNGGVGGRGGNGGDGDTEGVFFPNGSYGGTGGTGGNGGNGGFSVSVECNNAELTAGIKGAAGDGGTRGKNRHNSSRNGNDGRCGTPGADAIR